MKESAGKLVSFDLGDNTDDSGQDGKWDCKLPNLGLKFDWKALEVNELLERLDDSELDCLAVVAHALAGWFRQFWIHCESRLL